MWMNDQIENFFKHPRMKRNRKCLNGVGFAFESYRKIHSNVNWIVDDDDDDDTQCNGIFFTIHDSWVLTENFLNWFLKFHNRLVYFIRYSERIKWVKDWESVITHMNFDGTGIFACESNYNENKLTIALGQWKNTEWASKNNRMETIDI